MAFDPTTNPYDAVVRITDSLGQGSGVLVAPDEVLTASHVVHDTARGAATDIVATPAAEPDGAPFGSSADTDFHYNVINIIENADGTGSIDKFDSQFDYALIHLATPFDLGSMGLQPDFAGGAVNVSGYPAVANGLMETASENVAADPGFDVLDGPSLGAGSSGGPLWIEEADGPHVVGLVSTTDFAVRLTAVDQTQIESWIRQDHAAPAPAPPPVPRSGTHDQYTVAEAPSGGLYVQDNVPNRDGATSLPAEAEIAFQDGIGVGDPTGSAEDVARLYGAALGRAPDVGGLTYWTNVVDGSHASLATVAGDFAASPEFISDYGNLDNTGFVQRLYQNVLHRAGDAGGVQYWANTLAGGQSRGSVLLSFAESPENRTDTLAIAGDKHDAEAYRLYQAALGRTPDQGGLQYWSSVLANGASPTDVAAGFMNSPEFQSKYGGLDNNGFVTAALYGNVLSRAPDAGGLQYWDGVLASGQSRSAVLATFSDSNENRARTASATHDGWVFIKA